MLGINKAPIVWPGLTTEFYQMEADPSNAKPFGLVAHSENVIAVVVQNRLNNLDGTANAVEVLIGSGASVIWQLLPGQESPVIYTESLDDLWAMVRTGATSVWFGFMVYKLSPQCK